MTIPTHTAHRAPLPVLCLAALLFLACPALAAESSVVGTGKPSQDVPNVQAAVDKGGLVTLRGNFNFGTDGRVRITKNVRIKGEADSVGEPVTTITGGYWTFYAPLPVKGAPPASKGPIISIRDIRFDGARCTPLHFPHAGGLDVRGCTVIDVIPQPMDIHWSGGDSLSFQAGIVVGNRIDHPKEPLKRAVTGTVRIENNRFLMENNRPDETAGFGVLADWTWGAEITIAQNTIHRASRNGIELLDNVLSDKGKGSIAVKGNRITTDEEGIPYPHVYGPNGIVAGWYFDTSGGADFSRNSRMAITGNRIEGRGENSTGLLLYTNDAVVTCNDVVMGGGRGARGIVQTGSRGFFANNRIRGQASYALYCYPFEALTATANNFAWTEVGDFTGFKGQVLLGGTLNVLVGAAPSVIDKGRGNRHVDVAPCTLPEVDPEGDAWEPVE
ncbi:MAG: right-handed parallel beta-helix repeat-containing protein [Desulfovibrionaceae bacterium]|nr:right-handed parallel beta-helix repeat-containing protein [Desulfovibrionaceae bacterium]